MSLHYHYVTFAEAFEDLILTGEVTAECPL